MIDSKDVFVRSASSEQQASVKSMAHAGKFEFSGTEPNAVADVVLQVCECLYD